MITASLHRPVRAVASEPEGAVSVSWVTITDEDENDITIFLPQDKAERIAEIINEPPAPRPT